MRYDTEDAYDAPDVTLRTQAENLEVLCELFVEFDNMKENGIDLLTVVKFQGWKCSSIVFKVQFSIIWLENIKFMPNLLSSKLLLLSLGRRLSF